MDHTSIIAGIYEAFGRGDVEAVLSAMADDVQWDHWADSSAHRAGVPWLAPRTGLAGVADFFGALAGWQLHDFQVLSLMSGNGQVAVEVVIETTVAEGVRFRDEELHVWWLNDEGKVTRMRHYTDTAKHIAAWRAT